MLDALQQFHQLGLDLSNPSALTGAVLRAGPITKFTNSCGKRETFRKKNV